MDYLLSRENYARFSSNQNLKLGDLVSEMSLLTNTIPCSHGIRLSSNKPCKRLVDDAYCTTKLLNLETSRLMLGGF